MNKSCYPVKMIIAYQREQKQWQQKPTLPPERSSSTLCLLHFHTKILTLTYNWVLSIRRWNHGFLNKICISPLRREAGIKAKGRKFKLPTFIYRKWIAGRQRIFYWQIQYIFRMCLLTATSWIITMNCQRTAPNCYHCCHYDKWCAAFAAKRSIQTSKPS